LRSGRLRYRLARHDGGQEILTRDEILHLRYRLAADGVMGLSPIQIARESFNLALTQQDQASAQAAKNFRPEGVLSFPQSLTPIQKEGAFDAMGKKAEDISRRGGIMVLDGGAEWNPLAFSSKDAEFLESRKLSDLAIARIFSVPPTAIGITDNATYSNVDGESRALVQRCLAPMAKRIEQAMNAALLPAGARQELFVEHDLAGLLRGDIKARYEAYRIGREWGWLSPNEIRKWENLRGIENGDEYLSPLNMTQLGEREED
jgi:HK97 family phage portal protein